MGADEVDAVFAAVDAKRMEWACGAEPSRDAFATRVLGGKWIAEHLGLVADAVQACASTSDAECWCKVCGVQTPTRFSFERYGGAICVALARYWASAMGYVYAQWVRSDDELRCALPSSTGRPGVTAVAMIERIAQSTP